VGRDVIVTADTWIPTKRLISDSIFGLVTGRQPDARLEIT